MNTSTITINPDPAVSITGPDITYNNDIAQYSVSSLTGGSGNWSYAWYFKPSTSPTFSAIANGVANVPYYSDAVGANTTDLTLTLYSLSEGYDYEVYCLVSNDGTACNQASSNAVFTSIEHNLPIELGEFKAECFGDYIIVEWTTWSEINNEWFILEKSFDGKNWGRITKIPGAGNSNQALVYSYIDKNNIGSNQYYRLTQIDYDNTSKTFEIISANCSPINKPIEIYPNPTKSILNINDNNNVIEKIEIVNDLGQVLVWFTSNERILDISDLKPGIYILKINEQNYKIIKQ
ncbi:MAG TPA: T9SS type A sorting domain-containing protein [bacterium]|nr:T9SS type A sorting domain-containing protein [bacterium]